MRINSLSPVISYNKTTSLQTNFEGKKENKVCQNSVQKSSTIGMKEIPVIVLLALSPLNAVNVQAQNTDVKNPEKTEFVSQQYYTKRYIVNDKNRSYTFIKVDNDNDYSNFEGLFFEYKEKGNSKTLRGRIIGISETPDEKGQYVGVYQKYDDKTGMLQEMEVCKLYEKFGKEVFKFINSGEDNEAITVASLNEFQEEFAPEMETAKTFSEILTK